jgi:hypothetical protein
MEWWLVVVGRQLVVEWELGMGWMVGVEPECTHQTWLEGCKLEGCRLVGCKLEGCSSGCRWYPPGR